MTAHQFNQLDYHHQTETVLKAVFLADRLTADHYVRLYNMDAFYIEAYFDDRTHLIDQFRGFAHTNELMPYLEEMRIAV